MSGNRDRARKYRNNSTKPEVLLWDCLKQDQIGYYIRRQYPFDDFILDFYCSKPRADIEVDGKIHQLKKGRDAIRDSKLRANGVTVIRFSAESVLRNPDFVAQQIKDKLDELSGSKNEDASPNGEAGER